MKKSIMRFTKMHGIGNDYIYVDCISNPPPRNPAALSKAISDRHYGVGSDGLILICPSERGDARMRMFNADGSEAEMCGNGIRCVAKYLYDHGLSKNNPLQIETGRGLLTLELNVTAGKVHDVTVDMGEPILDAEKIPTTLPGPRVVDFPLVYDKLTEVGDRWISESGFGGCITCVSMGNPHAVLFCRDVARVPLSTVGPILEHWDRFPQRINVHFVQLHARDEVTMRTWERGSGITLACGTGACAVCVAGVLTGRTSRAIRAHLPGGDLSLHWADNQHVSMTGPAVEVFRGEWPDSEPHGTR
jgi:diaminopimelate epimerase